MLLCHEPWSWVNISLAKCSYSAVSHRKQQKVINTPNDVCWYAVLLKSQIYICFNQYLFNSNTIRRGSYSSLEVASPIKKYLLDGFSTCFMTFLFRSLFYDFLFFNVKNFFLREICHDYFFLISWGPYCSHLKNCLFSVQVLTLVPPDVLDKL